MLQRRTGPITIAQWLTSHKLDLRERAETVLYHLGPDAGEILLQAAEQESRWTRQRWALIRIPLHCLCAAAAFYVFRLFDSNVQISLLFAMAVAASIQPACQFAEGVATHHTRLRALALALARRNDLRCIGPLIEIWRPIGFFGWQVRDVEVEHELARLLPMFMAQNRLTLRSDKLSLLRKKMRRLCRPILTDERADLLVTVFQLLVRTGGERNRTILERFAHTRATQPNAEFVREAAEALLTVPSTPSEVATVIPPAGSASALSVIAPPPTTKTVPLSLRQP